MEVIQQFILISLAVFCGTASAMFLVFSCLQIEMPKKIKITKVSTLTKELSEDEKREEK